jgi:thiol-disulfide isomerase/thioredoxin
MDYARSIFMMNSQKGLILGIVLATAVGVASSVGIYMYRRGRQPVAQGSASKGPAVIRFVNNPEPAPPFLLHDLTGKVISSADLKGKVVVLNFWATWCPPCREEIPELIQLQKQYGDRLQVIGASEDDDPPEKVLQFAQKMGINYPIVMASSELVSDYGGVPALPTSFIIDPQSRVEQKHTGLYQYDVYEREVRSLAGLPVDARIERFTDAGQVFLTNAANATELPDVDFSGLTDAQKQQALHRMNAEGCTCGCKLTVAECRVNDSECPVSKVLAAEIVKQVRAGNGKSAAPAGTPPKSLQAPKT